MSYAPQIFKSSISFEDVQMILLPFLKISSPTLLIVAGKVQWKYSRITVIQTWLQYSTAYNFPLHSVTENRHIFYNFLNVLWFTIEKLQISHLMNTTSEIESNNAIVTNKICISHISFSSKIHIYLNVVITSWHSRNYKIKYIFLYISLNVLLFKVEKLQILHLMNMTLNI